MAGMTLIVTADNAAGATAGDVLTLPADDVGIRCSRIGT